MRLKKSTAVIALVTAMLSISNTAVAQFRPRSPEPPPISAPEPPRPAAPEPMEAPQPNYSFEPQGTVESKTVGQGSVVVERQGELYSLAEGDEVFQGDVVKTTTDGTTRLKFTASDGTPCSVSLSSAQMFTVTSSSCTAPAPVTMNATQIAALEGSTVAGTAGSGVGAAVFGIPAALGALGVAAAASDDDNDGTAASPG